jgi:hypothetical protein
MIEAGDHVQHGCLASAVWADNGKNFAFPNFRANINDSAHATEILRHSIDREFYAPAGASRFIHAAVTLNFHTGKSIPLPSIQDTEVIKSGLIANAMGNHARPPSRQEISRQN